MAIKFNCPHCGKALNVKDNLAGKKGPCPACKKVLTVPEATPAPAAAAAGTPPAPSSAPPADTAPEPAPAAPAGPSQAELEAEAAALLADKPEEAAPVESKTIDFNCPMCDAELHLPADLAGKKHPCPECRRIIKVPELVKTGPKDWSKPAANLPSGARRPTEPVPEGAWDQSTATKVGREVLEQAGAIPEVRTPLTWGQRIKRGTLAAAALAVLAVGALLIYNWMGQRREQAALKDVLDYATSEEARDKIRAEGQAALHTGAGEYYLRAGGPEDGKKAQEQFNRASTLLRGHKAAGGSEHDAALADLAEAQVGLGGSDEQVRNELRFNWGTTAKALQQTLKEITPEGRLETLRAVTRRLGKAGQPKKALDLASVVFPAEGTDKAEAQAVVGLVLLGAGHEKEAGAAADRALAAYPAKAEERPPLKSAVVALAVALKKAPPKPGKGEDVINEVGQAAGQARLGQWESARQAVEKGRATLVYLQARVELADAALDAKTGDTTDVDAALRLALELRDKADNRWLLLRLVRLGARAGANADLLQKVADAIPDVSLRGRAQLAVLRGRLESAKDVVAEDAVDKVNPNTLSHLLARQALARHNVRRDGGWAKAVQQWPQPARAFGSLGVALGLQGED